MTVKRLLTAGSVGLVATGVLAGGAAAKERGEDRSAASAQAPQPDSIERARAPVARAELRNARGRDVGSVTFRRGPSDRRGLRRGVLEVEVLVQGIPSRGFHGFHLHAVGACDPTPRRLPNGIQSPFATAGPHFNPAGRPHREHPGDFPPIYINRYGSARVVFTTDRLSVRQLVDRDGNAVMIHQNPDNLANIPGRYRSTLSPNPGPDPQTLEGGDADPRLACGVVRRPGGSSRR